MPIAKSRREITALYVALGVLLAIWFLLAWVIADSSLERDIQEAIKTQTLALDELTGKTAQSIDQGLDYLHEIPGLVAKEERVLEALSRLVFAQPPAASMQHRRVVWTEDSLLKRIDAYLEKVAVSLDADVVWVMNSSGDCIASSNARRPDSFIGTNYADREYFRMAREGKRGQQYAVGRKTNIPGLFFSAPIVLDGHFLGVAVAKIDLPKLAHMVSQADSFITDKNGVIILARDPSLEMRSLPDAATAKLSAAERSALYKRENLAPLKIDSWEPPGFPSLHRFEQEAQPVLISTFNLSHESLGVYAFKRIPAAADFAVDRRQMFLLISSTGALVLIVVAAALQFALSRKRSEYLAAHSASLLRAAIESTADGILVIDRKNRVSTYNQHFARIGRLPAFPDANGRIAETLMPLLDRLEDAPAFLDKTAELEAHPELDSFDGFRLKDGTEIECYSLPQRLQGAIVGRVWSFRDVTAHRQAERDLRASRDNLEQTVQERTSELRSTNAELLAERTRLADLIKQLAEAHQQLLQSEKMASIGQLAAGVAHEINNPIGFVSSNLTTLLKYTTDLMAVVAAYEQAEAALPADLLGEIKALKQTIDLEFLRDDVGSLVSESIDGLQRVSRIVQDLKEFSQMGELAWRWANIEQGLESTLNVACNELKVKAEVIKDYGRIPEVQCIPSQINQVFMNLLVNAAQAIEARGQITVRTLRDGDGVRVEISDTGQGISDENLNRIFDPFFTTKPVGKGSGLGLSISYGIVQQHQGRIEVNSEIGKGSTFRVWLPVSRRGA